MKQRLSDDEAVEWIAMVLRKLGDARHGSQVDFQLMGEQVSRRLRKELTNGSRQLQLAE